MATKLDKPLIRDTGLKNGNREVYVVLIPTPDGGSIVFREKGKHGNGVTISLSDIIKGQSVANTEEKSEKKPRIKREAPENPGDIDLVDLGTLEARLMVDGNPVMTTEVKGYVWHIVREIREEMREDAGMPHLVRPPERTKKED